MVGMAVGAGVEAEFLSESVRETSVRKGFSILESAEDGRYLPPKRFQNRPNYLSAENVAIYEGVLST